MPAKNLDLHGNAPDKAGVALLIIDVINDLEFDEGHLLLRHALPMAKKIARLKQKAKEENIPVIYVNDNFGRWRSDFRSIVRHCIEDNTRGKEIVEMLQPDDDDYFIVKPKHSAFYNTTLDLLLQYLGTKSLILTGMAGNICILFTASDAYMRDFNLFIPSDCIASNLKKDNTIVLRQMAAILKADTRSSGRLDLKKMLKKTKKVISEK